ncbi:MAG: hypothetical protein VXB01_17915, partial [Opitutae bacterium]
KTLVSNGKSISDVEAWVRLIINLPKMEESTLIRKNAIRWVRQNFDISQNASKLHNLFIQATQKPI